MTAFVFDATQVEPDNGRVGAIPKGWYPAMVEKTEIKPTTGGTGAYIAVQFGVVDGAYKGSKIFTNFNIQNDNEKAVEIGRKQLSSLCHAVNVLQMTDTDQLKNKPFFIRVKHVPAEMDPQDPTKVKYEEKNEPTAYRSANDQAALAEYQKQGVAPAPAARPPVAAPVTPPAAAAWAPPAQPGPTTSPATAWQPPATPAAAPVAPVQQPWGQPPAQTPAAPVAAPAAAPVAGAPAWANAPVQPWQGDPNAGTGGSPAAPAAPVMTPEQQAAHAAAAAAPPPWMAQPQ
jgi:hypothetical protein